MTDPVICTDGYSYERNAIEQHFRAQIDLQMQLRGGEGEEGGPVVVTSPITKERLNSPDVFANRALQALLQKYHANC